MNLDPGCVSSHVDAAAVEFEIDCGDAESLARIQNGLMRLGCTVVPTRLRLHVTLPAHPAIELLSAREVELVCLASKGYTDKEIADQVSLSIYTVRSYWVRICHKLGAHNRTHAVSIVFGNEPPA